MKRWLLLLFFIPLLIKGQTTITICDGDSALIYGNWQMNAGTYTNSNGNTTTLVVDPLPVITPNFILNKPWDTPEDPDFNEVNKKGEFILHDLHKITPIVCVKKT